MSDILFRYLLMARQRERSSFLRLFARDDQLLAAGVEQLVESAAVHVTVRSQHEHRRRENVQVPASEHLEAVFYDDAKPRRPKSGQFEERRSDFPLRATLVVDTCPSCLGKAHTRCSRCRGQKQVDCWRCRGSGQASALGRIGVGRCGSCGGSGRRRCPSCIGSGRQICAICRGEGESAKWSAEIYQWQIEERSAEEYPLADPRLAEAFRRWVETEPDLVTSLKPAVVAEHLGFETPESAEVVARADLDRRRLEGEARKAPGRCLFHRTECRLVPVGYAVVREGGTAHYFHLVGRGEKALDLEPGQQFDGVKVAGWLGLGGSGLVGWEAVFRLLEAYGLEIFDAFRIAAGVPQLGLLTAAAASGAILLAGVHRILLRPPPVLTIGLLPASGVPTPYLTCVAYLGSYTQRLIVLDRIYDVQLERLLGKMRPERQSASLTVELKDGRRVRVLEVARPAQLSDEQLDLALQALDGAMILEEIDDPAIELEARLRMIAANQTGGGRRTRIDRVAIDRSGTVDADDDAVLGLEAIRRAFVHDMDDSGWNRRFKNLWRPIERLLEPRRLRTEP